LASVEGAAGNQRAAFELLGEAQAASMAGDEHWMSADIHRLAGETMLAGTAIRPAPSESSTLALARWHGSRARSCGNCVPRPASPVYRAAATRPPPRTITSRQFIAPSARASLEQAKAALDALG
jgi:hypothetical protein